jgi:TM2 domain-containing membrane protein YozV
MAMEPAETEELVCAGCGTPHHKDCYAENGGCTVFGCRCAPPEEPKVAVSAPELVFASTAGSNGVTPVATPGATVASGGQSAPMLIESAITTIPAPVAKNKMTFILLGVFLGALGGHNFYAGYYGKAIGQVCLTVLTLGYGSFMSWLWAVIEICTVGQDSKGVQFQS